ncbi:DNA primase [Legionella londiniensis]|uniref:DNA primase n=1 Tax=Legionella londiniensis TaxID=45068 RepID=A0A0W0VSE5_9GAMM|nr:DNA primase [Legionella londiniensis]KTD23156.1 DNA primase DnaG [Legionella londiniensis]STX93833.1 DNA primase DnaG [Legionella londiniensis]
MSGLIPQPFIDEILHRTDIVEFIDGYVPLKKRGNSHIACCPFHHEKTPSFNVVAKKQFYHCFGCGASGNVISFAMNYLQLSFIEAIDTLAQRLGMQVPRDNKSGHNQTLSLYSLLTEVAKFYQQQLKTSGQQAVLYLKNRGVSGEIAKLYQLGYAPQGWHSLESKFRKYKKELITTGMVVQKEDGKIYDRYRHRIIYPIHDRHGRIIGFGGRSIDPEQQPKYLNSPETVIFQKSRELYGLHQVIQQNSNPPKIIIVEGYMDVIALAQFGIFNAVAALGTATSSYHIQLLSKYTRQLVFCFDGDAAGRKAAWRALESCFPHLNEGLDASFVFLPEGHDPDSMVRLEGKEGFLERMIGALSLSKFFLMHIMHDIDCSTLAGKSRLLNAASPYLQKMGEGPYRQLLINELARITRLDIHRINHLLAEHKYEKNVEPGIPIKRSPIRIAIALLLQHPEIYLLCKEQINPEILDDAKLNVLKTLMEQVAGNPEINTATLVESWRDTSYFESLNKLAAWDHQVPEEALAKEFIDIILFLTKQSRENKIQQLLEKARHEGLSEKDRLQLQQMLQQRHRSLHGNDINPT